MSSALTHLEAVRERLLAIAAPAGPFADVRTVLELAGDDRQSVQVPAVMVGPLADAGGANTAGRGTIQQITTSISVIVVVAARNDPRGERAIDALTPCVDAVRTRLIGWSVPGQRDALRLVRGALIEVDEGRAWWGDTYEFQRLLSAT